MPPALAPVANVSGASAASPTAGSLNLFAQLAQATTPEAMQEAQLKKTQTEAAIYEAAQAKRQALLTQLQNNPGLAQDGKFMGKERQAYQGTGIAAPTQQGANGQPEASAAGLGAESFQSWFQKNQGQLVGSPQGSRSAFAEAAGVPMTPQQKQALESLPYIPSAAQNAVQERAAASFEKNTTDLLKQAMKSGNAGQVRAIVQQYESQAGRYNLDPAGMDSYLSSAVEAMSPKEKAQLRLTNSKADQADATTNKINTLLGPERNIMQARVSEIGAMTDSIKTLKNPKAQALMGQYQDDVARVGLINDQAQWYARRQAAGVGQVGGIDPREFGDTISAYRDGMTANTQLVGQIESSKRALQATAGYGTLGSVTRTVDEQIKTLSDQEKEYKDNINYYQGQMNTLVAPLQAAAGQPGAIGLRGGAAAGAGQPPAPKPAPGSKGTVSHATLLQMAKAHFKGDVNAAKKDAEAQGFAIGN